VGGRNPWRHFVGRSRKKYREVCAAAALGKTRHRRGAGLAREHRQCGSPWKVASPRSPACSSRSRSPDTPSQHPVWPTLWSCPSARTDSGERSRLGFTFLSTASARAPKYTAKLPQKTQEKARKQRAATYDEKSKGWRFVCSQIVFGRGKVFSCVRIFFQISRQKVSTEGHVAA